MTSRRFVSVWDAIEDTPQTAENMKLRSALMIALTHITRQKWTQKQAPLAWASPTRESPI